MYGPQTCLDLAIAAYLVPKQRLFHTNGPGCVTHSLPLGRRTFAGLGMDIGYILLARSGVPLVWVCWWWWCGGAEMWGSYQIIIDESGP